MRFSADAGDKLRSDNIQSDNFLFSLFYIGVKKEKNNVPSWRIEPLTMCNSLDLETTKHHAFTPHIEISACLGNFMRTALDLIVGNINFASGNGIIVGWTEYNYGITCIYLDF